MLTFPNINETIPDGPFSYPGQSVREVITVDPANSPLLQTACSELKSHLECELLLRTMQFVSESLFEKDSCSEENIKHLLEVYAVSQESPEVSLEVFLKHKAGVCRHVALTTTYLINELIKEGQLKGQVLLIRDETPLGRHAWTLFLTEDAAWHLDPYWGIFENGKTGAGFSHLCKKYGKKTMERQKLRWEDGN